MKARPRVRKPSLVVDLAESDPFGPSGQTPPLPVLVEFGDTPMHRFRLPRGKFDIDRMVNEFGSRLVRSDSRASTREDREKWIDAVFHLKIFGAIVHYDPGSLTIYAPTRRKALFLASKMKRYVVREKEIGGRFELISRHSGIFDTETVTFEPSTIYKAEDLALYYGDDFPDWATDFAARLSCRHSGLTILEGSPGTGKTSFLRHLMGILEKSHRFYFIPSSAVESIGSSEFVGFWHREQCSHKNRQFVLVLEDAEEALMSRANDNRSLVSSLLNITDGLVGDFLKLQVVCTINCKAQEIDKALRRPGRLLAHRIFRRLGYQEAQRLARHRGLTLPAKEDYSLAEIFNESFAEPPEEKIVGFAA